MSALLARLEAEADALTAAVFREMYADPFWKARYGERADVHGKRDGRFHIDYVMEALRANDPRVFEKYARWLQQVLTTRGMCTRHLAENFRLLAEAIATWPDGAPAVGILEAGIAALRHPDGPARALVDAAPQVIARAAAIVGDDQHLAELISYAADALAQNSPAQFVRHATWLQAQAPVRDRLRALRDAALQVVPEVELTAMFAAAL